MDDRQRASTSENEFTDVPFDGEDDTTLRPTIVELPSRKTPRVSPASSLDMFQGIDPEILKELPPEMQQEILLEQAAAQKRANDAAIRAAQAEIDGEEIDLEFTPDLVGGGWTCHVCTFANHAEIPSCEMCDTMRPDLYQDEEDWEHVTGNRSRAGSDGYSKIAQRIQSSVFSNSLKKIKMPATPATTTMTQKDEPTAEDLLIAATMKIQQLQTSATQGVQSLISKATASRRATPIPSASSGKPPSPHAAALLQSLQQDLNTKCEPGDELYETLLQRLWNAIYQDAPRSPRKTGTAPLSPPLPRRPFERVSEGWVDIGFQGPNPDTDFRGGGLLALKCLVYVFEAYAHKMIEVVSAHKPEDGKKWYPVCVAGINLTCMIAGLLRLGNGQFADANEKYWALFEEPSAFYQLYFHAFVKMDAAWHRMNASYMEFGVVLKATRRMVTYIIDQAPQTLDELSVAADKTFIDRFVATASKAYLENTENGECPDPYNLLEDENGVLVTSPRSTLSAVFSKLTGGSSAAKASASNS